MAIIQTNINSLKNAVSEAGKRIRLTPPNKLYAMVIQSKEGLHDVALFFRKTACRESILVDINQTRY